jgi:hypothetical protein
MADRSHEPLHSAGGCFTSTELTLRSSIYIHDLGKVDDALAAEEQKKAAKVAQLAVTDSDGNVVAEIDKLLYVRRKDRGANAKPQQRIAESVTTV